MLLSADEVANKLNIAKCTVAKWAKTRRLIGTKMGSQWKFSSDYIEKLSLSPSEKYGIVTKKYLQGTGKVCARNVILYKINENGCHIPVNRKPSKEGYFYFKKGRDGKRFTLHRSLFEQVHGPVSLSRVVRHLCNNPSCVNIEHLAEGTQADNIRDRGLAGRTARGSKNGRSRNHIRKTGYLGNVMGLGADPDTI